MDTQIKVALSRPKILPVKRFMKFLVKSLPVALVTLMLNCSKSSPSPSPFVGTWTKWTTTYSSCTYSANNLTVHYTCPPIPNSLSCEQVTFNSNGTVDIASTYIDGSSYYHVNTSQGTYSVQGNQLTETLSGKTTNITFDMSADKKTLTTTYKNNTIGCTVTETYSK